MSEIAGRGGASFRLDASALWRVPETWVGLTAITAFYASFGHMIVKFGTADLGAMRASGQPPDPIGVTLLPLLAFVAAMGWVVWKSSFWRWWVFWRRPTSLTAQGLTKWQFAIRSLLAAVLLTEAFAIATALIYVYARGVLNPEHELTEILWPLERHYAWHLANAVPVLAMSDTFHVDSPVTFEDPWSGTLLVGFKLLVIAPLITVGRVLLQRPAEGGGIPPRPARP
jgi:hypothetical protein